MQTLRDIPVIWSLYLIILLVSAGGLLYASASYYIYYSFESKKTAVAELESIAEIAGLGSAEALLANDRAAAAKSLSALMANKHIIAADIYDKKGGLFASFSRGDSRRDALSGKIPDNTHYFDGRYLHLFHDITIANSKAGSIYILHDVSRLRSQKWKALVIGALIFVSCMGLIALPSFFLQGIISTPILILAATMQKITHDKDYTFRMLKGTNNEIGLLINDFNKMMHAILAHSMSLEEAAAHSSAELQTTQATLSQERYGRMEEHQQLEKLIAKQQKVLNGVKTLKGIVPICSSCKKIRDEHGYWNRIEKYIAEHTDAEFSHGICPECSEKLYPKTHLQINPEEKRA
jgi:methyl-accepting chemotaxis protein